MSASAVCQLKDLTDGAAKAVRVEGRKLVLIRKGDQVYALRNICPHQGARLSDGLVTCSRVAAAVGEYKSCKEGQILRCPWHNWEFDIASGQSLHNPDSVRVANYHAYVEAGRVYVESAK